MTRLFLVCLKLRAQFRVFLIYLNPSKLTESYFLSPFLDRWDEWVPESRLLKLTEQNLELQKTLQQANVASGQGGSTASKAQSKSAPGAARDSVSTRAGTRKDGTRGTKRAREDVSVLFSFLVPLLNPGFFSLFLLLQDESSKKPEMKLTVPEVLKTILVDDWEAVTKNNQVRLAGITLLMNSTLTLGNSQLVTLPRNPTALEVLEDFATYVKKNKPPQ